MAQHKAPTQVSIAPLAEKSGLEQFVSRYWMPAAVVAVLIGGAIVYAEFSETQEKAIVAEHWDSLRSKVDLQAAVGGDLPAPSELKVLADALEATPAGPWARVLEIQSALKANEFDEAKTAIDTFNSDFPSHPLAERKFEFEDDQEVVRASLPTRLREISEAQSAWTAEHPRLFEAPEVAADAPRVRLNTDYGPILIGLYPELAPKHVENFIKLCKEGFYDNVKVHRVLRDQLIQAGDPNTIEGAPQTWGSGGPGYTIPQELNEAWHFRGMLAAARNPVESESSGSQFYITAQPQPQYDKQYTVFGRVLEGMDVVDTLAAQVEEGVERPENPAVIQSTEVL